MRAAAVFVLLAVGAQAMAAPSIRVSGNKLVDANGQTVQLRGANYSGYEFTAIEGFNPADPSGAQAGQSNGPLLSAMSGSAWGLNAVRVPLNEASWRGGQCVDSAGALQYPDPLPGGGGSADGSHYRAAVIAQVNAITAAGMYAIVDLHWAAPGRTCPELQTQMADADNSLAFWTSVANTFKSNPGVIFEPYNEPYFYGVLNGADDWSVMMTGGALQFYPAINVSGSSYRWVFPLSVTAVQGSFSIGDTVSSNGVTGTVQDYSSTSKILTVGVTPGVSWTNGATISDAATGASATLVNTGSWTVASMQEILNTIRATGASNVVVVNCINFADDCSKWGADRPTDTLGQMAMGWHPYPPTDQATGVTIHSAGLGYKVGDTWTGVPNSQAAATYAPVILTVTSVNLLGGVTGVSIQSSGSYLYTSLPSNPLTQGSTSGSGIGAKFDVSGRQIATGIWSMPANWPVVQSVASTVPVILTETGDHSASGAPSAPWMSQLIPWADSYGISYTPWAWDLFANSTDNILISDVNGTPTDGEGAYYKAHTQCMAYPSAPSISKLSKLSGTATQVITITGKNFCGLTSVKFNGTPASYYIADSSTSVEATIPAGATTGSVTVTNSAGTATYAIPFTVTTDSSPAITGISPLTAKAGSTVTLTGNNFLGTTQVAFSGPSGYVAGSQVIALSATSMTVKVPSISATTTGPVQATNLSGSGTSTVNFTTFVPVAPGITGYSPTSGHAGSSVTISGYGFTDATAVYLPYSSGPCQFTVVNDSTIVATIPSEAAGSYQFYIVNPEGGVFASTSFTVD